MKNKIFVQKISSFVFYLFGLAILLYEGYIVIISNRNSIEVMDILLTLAIAYAICIFIGMQLHIASLLNMNEKNKAVKLGGFSYLLFYVISLGFLLLNGGPPWQYDSWLGYVADNSNLVPFKTIYYYLGVFADQSINVNIAIENLIGNFILYMPMAIVAAMLLPKLTSRVKKYTGFVALVFIVQLIQIITKSGVFDIDDILLNTVGFIIADLCFTFIMNKIRTLMNKPHLNTR